MDKVVLGQASVLVLPLSHCSIISALHVTHHFCTTEKRTRVWSFEPSDNEIRFHMLWNIGEKSTVTYFFVLERIELSYCGQGRVYLNIMAEDSIIVLWCALYLQITVRYLNGQENFTILISLMHYFLVFTTNSHKAWTHNAECCCRRHVSLLWMQVSSSEFYALSNLWCTDWTKLHESCLHNGTVHLVLSGWKIKCCIMYSHRPYRLL